ncbi:hypothetical protein BDV96DRAFT_377380 [Lophiotrema nucula]|uniref:BZIP domain-containing protein n=1 Tax=Lophiotrema nucula TaxID=690887 RepID=A0A6A5YGK5_9PLEO|nr:hypothetical protein BDV96DRAFT_377380 [Lophiotrema nucula]
MDRSVANLTTEQLYRKRAFDRENQRASRARKKSRISELEDEVGDLKRRLAHSEAQVKRLESSEASLRDAVNSARLSLQTIDVAQPLPGGLPSPSASLSGSIPRASLSTTTPQPFGSGSTIDYGSKSSQSISQPHATENPDSFALRDEVTGLTLGFPKTEGMQAMLPYGSLTTFGANHAYSLSFLDPIAPESDPSFASTDGLQSLALGKPKAPHWERLPSHIAATCRLDTVFLDTVETSRRQMRNRFQLAEATSSHFPSISSLLNPDEANSHHSISNIIGNHGRVTLNVASLPGRMGTMYLMCIYLRWLVSPTKQNYEAMPEWIRPTESQLTIPHPVWIDLVVWPEAREAILHEMDWSQFEAFRAVMGPTVSVNWPYELSDIFAVVSEREVKLSPVFENHIRQGHNWTVGPAVSEKFPFMKCAPIVVLDPMQLEQERVLEEARQRNELHAFAELHLGMSSQLDLSDDLPFYALLEGA